MGIVQKAGAWYSYEGSQLGQGREKAKEALETSSELASKIEKDIRSRSLLLAVTPETREKAEAIEVRDREYVYLKNSRRSTRNKSSLQSFSLQRFFVCWMMFSAVQLDMHNSCVCNWHCYGLKFRLSEVNLSLSRCCWLFSDFSFGSLLTIFKLHLGRNFRERRGLRKHAGRRKWVLQWRFSIWKWCGKGLKLVQPSLSHCLSWIWVAAACCSAVSLASQPVEGRGKVKNSERKKNDG